VNQEWVFPDRYFDHWKTEPATGKWLETSAKVSAIRNCPTATIGQLQKKNPPIVVSPSAKSAKIPVDGEM